MDDLRPVRDGDEFEFESFSLRAVHLSGHTSGHICLLEPERRVLFAGDTLISHITPNPILEPTPQDPTVRRKSLVAMAWSEDKTLWDLSDDLVTHDELFAMWRSRHVLMVERQIGSKTGNRSEQAKGVGNQAEGKLQKGVGDLKNLGNKSKNR